MLRRLDDRVALVTGGSRGIGRAICLRLAREGAAIAVNYRADARRRRRRWSRRSTGDGGRAIAVQADVSRRAEVDAMAARVTGALGPIDILVNNAGILARGTSLDMDEADFDRMIAVNVKGIMHAVQAVAPGDDRAPHGRHRQSLVARRPRAPPSRTRRRTRRRKPPSSRSPSARPSSSARDGIRVNAICPGYVKTEMLASIENAENRDQLLALNAKAMLGRIGVPDDIAGVCAFLASDDAVVHDRAGAGRRRRPHGLPHGLGMREP